MPHTIPIIDADTGIHLQLWINLYKQLKWNGDSFLGVINEFLATYDAKYEYESYSIVFQNEYQMVECMLKWG